jgi:flagellar basal-body rod modification protein FlgD
MDAIGSLAPASAAPAKNAFSELGSEDFVKIIFTELGNQDPLQPSDSKALLEQISSLRSIQSDMDLGSRLGTLVSQNELSSATGLIGKLVSGVSDRNERVLDFVVSVSRTKDGAILNLGGGQKVAVGNVDEVLDPALLGGGV